MNGQHDLLGVDGSPESLVEQSLLDPSNDAWPQELVAVVQVLEASFIREGVPADSAANLAITGALALGEYRGGKMLYLPRGDRLRTALKHAKAWRIWRGNNIEEIMELLDVTQIRAYAVLAEQRALHVGKIQGGLFKGEEKCAG